MSKHNKINYIEFLATDLEAVKKFYNDTFNWTFTDYGPTYVAFNDGALDGGFELGEPPVTNFPLVILYSDTLETTLKSVEDNGGVILKPIFSFPGGRRFHFADPSKNELAVWSDL